MLVVQWIYNLMFRHQPQVNKKNILDRINEVIEDEKGISVTIDSMLEDAELDSLGTLMMIVTLDSEFPMLDKNDDGKSLDDLGLKTLSIRDLVNKCRLSTTPTYMEPKTEKHI